MSSQDKHVHLIVTCAAGYVVFACFKRLWVSELFICKKMQVNVLKNLTFAFDTSSLFPLSCSHICRNVLLPCGCPVWSNRPIMVNVTLKTCSTRGLAHFSSSSLSSRTVNSSTVRASCCCLLAGAGSLLVGCSGHVSSVTRLIPRRGRVVDILRLGLTAGPDEDVSVFTPSDTVRNLWRFHGLF